MQRGGGGTVSEKATDKYELKKGGARMKSQEMANQKEEEIESWQPVHCICKVLGKHSQ